MDTIGYNPSIDWLNAYGAYEADTHNTINNQNKKVSGHINHMEKLQQFLTMATERTKDSNRLDMSRPEDQDLLAELLTYGGTEHIFPHGKTEWKEKELEHLHEKINQHIQGPLQRQVNSGTEEMVLLQHELTKALDLFKNGLKNNTDLITSINRRIQSAHS